VVAGKKDGIKKKGEGHIQLLCRVNGGQCSVTSVAEADDLPHNKLISVVEFRQLSRRVAVHAIRSWTWACVQVLAQSL